MPVGPAGCWFNTLQWGRRDFAADTAHTCNENDCEDMLQWGRRDFAAEVRIRGATRGLRDRASMGPPRSRGGSFKRGEVVKYTQVLLQWGRRVIAAEVNTITLLNKEQIWLQWGRRVIAAESAQVDAISDTVVEASMGQLRNRGGEAADRKSYRPSPRRLNRAAAKTRRNKADVVDDPVLPAVASMGPPLECGGDCHHLRREVRHPEASMGPPRRRGGTRSVRHGRTGYQGRASTEPPQETAESRR